MRRTLETIAAQRLRHLGKEPSLLTSRESLLDDIEGFQKAMQVRRRERERERERGSERHSDREAVREGQ